MASLAAVPRHQPGIFAVGTRAHHHLELDVVDAAGLRAALGRIREAMTTIAGVNLVVGLGAETLARVAPEAMPTDVGPFAAVTGPDGFTLPATQHDLWLWFHGAGPDDTFAAARAAVAELDGVATVATEQQGFAYRASQDLTGFEDGTENPPLDEAVEVATIADGEPGAGGSVVLLQRWVHDLDAFAALAEADQEAVIGRTLHGSVELAEDVLPADAHIARVVIEDDEGDELEVFRRSVAYGGVLEAGLLFVAFSADRARLARMLDRMAGVEDGTRDHLTRFSTPVTGAWYVAPSVEALTD